MRPPAPVPAPALAALAPASLLQLIWLASPALPVGGFSYSEGIESLMERAQPATESIASDWLVDQLHLGLARSDLAVLGPAIEAWRADDMLRIRVLNDWVLQTRETSEMRAQAEQMGRSLLEWLRNHDGLDPQQIEACAALPPTYPVAFALAVSPLGAGLRDFLLAYAFGWAENMVQAAMKAAPFGQRVGQRMLARLSADIPSAVESALQTGDADRQAFTPMLAILSSHHETQYSRLFRS
ncbi:MAG: urease accessory protein UreF [Polaromonas sp.]|nr:urease accessory protein UreF [Polaromonas sp.]